MTPVRGRGRDRDGSRSTSRPPFLGPTPPPPPPPQQPVPSSAGTKILAASRRAARLEAATWRNLARWVLRRPDLPREAAAFGYRDPLLAPITVMLGLCLLELVAFEIIVPWAPLRIAMLVLGLWGLVFVLGLLAAVTVLPHVSDDTGLRVRAGARLDLHILWTDVESVRARRRSHDGRDVQVVGDELLVLASKQTTVDLQLTRPVSVELPGGRTHTVTAVAFHADDPTSLVRTTRQHLADHGPSRRP